MFKRKDNGLWQEVLREYNGQPLRPPKYFYGKTQAEVKKKINEYKLEQERSETFGAVLDLWAEEHENEVSYNAHKAYSVPIISAREAFGDTPILEITAQDIDRHIKSIAAKGYAKRTVQVHLTLFNLVFDYAILHGYCTSNPASVVSVPKNLKTTKRVLPPESDIEKIKNSRSIPFGMFAYILLYTGCRRGELLALTYEDIDYNAKTININKSLYWQGNKPCIKSTKTKAGDRTIILLDVLAETLPKGKGYIFGGSKPMTNTAYRRAWDKYKKLSGVDLTPHQLRHLYATILYECGIDEKMAQELLGHSNISVTRNIYTHIRQQKISAAAEMLNAKIRM